MTSPDKVTVPDFARIYGTTTDEIQAACDLLRIDATSGVPINRNEDIRLVLRQWALEGRP